MAWYGYFLELPIVALDTWFSKNFTEICTAVLLVCFFFYIVSMSILVDLSFIKVVR